MLEKTSSLAIHFLLTCLGFLPNSVIRFISIIGTPLVSIFAAKEIAILNRNILEIYGLRKQSSFANTFKNQVIRHQITAALETIKGVSRPEKIEITGLEELERIMHRMEAENQGQILITGHLGSWEFIAFYAAKISKLPFYALAKASKYPALTQALQINREKMNIRVLWTDQKAFVKNMLKTMKDKHWLSFVMDQKPQGRVGPKVMFFNREVSFVSGPAQMSIRNQAPVLAVFCVREAPMKYQLISKEIISTNHGIKDLEVACQKMADEIEAQIKTYPEQWCWNYKRWVFDT